MVLRGWGATCLLRPVPHVVCVRITRSFEQARRMADGRTWTPTTPTFAEAEIRRSDQAHAARMNEQFGVTWGDPVLYDLVLNTDRISVDSCVEQIRALASRPEFAETPESRALLPNMALRGARARGAEGADARDARRSTSRSSADEGRVALRGIVLDAERARRRPRRSRAGGAPASASGRQRSCSADDQLAALFASSKTDASRRASAAQIFPRCFSRLSVSAERLR